MANNLLNESVINKRPLPPLLGLGWAIFVFLIVLSLYFQRVYFDMVFPDTLDYVWIIGLWLVLTLLGVYFASKLAMKYLIFTIFLVAGITGLIWLFYALQLPAEYPQDRTCQSWDCDLFLSFLRRCDSWTCQKPGVALLLCLTFGIFPPLWLGWVKKMGQNLAEREELTQISQTSSKALLYLALFFTVLGGFAVLAYYLVAFISAWLWLAIGFIPVFIQTRQKHPSNPNLEQTPSDPVLFDLPHIIHTLFYVVGLAIFMFSVGTRNYIPVVIFWQIGLGLFLAFLVYSLLLKTIGKKLWVLTIRWMEIFVFFVLFCGCAMGLMLFNHEIEIRLNYAISPFLMGVLISLLLLRWIGFVGEMRLPPSKLAFPIPFLKSSLMKPLVNNIVLLILFILAIIQITVDAVSALLVYGIGIGISTLGIFGAAGAVLSSLKNSEKMT